MSNDFERYSCQLILPGFNDASQQKLQDAKVLIVGVGGLGCPAALYLTAAGIGTIGIADYDVISISNLHRQILYNLSEVGLKKSATACKKLQEQNPEIKIIPIDAKIDSANVMEIIHPYDIIVDCTDNFDTKYILNDACVLSNRPLVYGAIYQYEGQAAVFNVAANGGTYTPNFRDLFPKVNPSQIPNCTEGGVMPTLAGIIGCIQANEVIKYFTGQHELLAGKIMMLDVQTLQSRIVKLKSISKTNIVELPETTAVPVISPKDLKKAIGLNEYDLIDVRTFEEHKLFNIGGRNIPLNELEKFIPQLSFEKSFLIYCSSGNRSREAVIFLKNKFPQASIFSLAGGLKSWNEVDT